MGPAIPLFFLSPSEQHVLRPWLPSPYPLPR